MTEDGESLIISYRKPLPLTTVELQKQGSRFLGLSSQLVMTVGFHFSIRISQKFLTNPLNECRSQKSYIPQGL